jgi:hypothetical protein
LSKNVTLKYTNWDKGVNGGRGETSHASAPPPGDFFGKNKK